MAATYTAGLGGHLPGSVAAVFARYRNLIPSNLVVSSPVHLNGHRNSLEGLLRAMRAQGARHYIVVVHGFHNGSGLFLPITRTTPAQATRDNLKTLLRIQERALIVSKARGLGVTDTAIKRLVDAMVKKSSAAERTSLGLTPARLHRLLTLMVKVQQSQIDWFEFRGCNLGRSPDSIEVFRRFFGARHLGAPNLHTFYGRFDVRTGAHWMNTHATHHLGGGTWHTFTENFTNPTGRAHCCLRVNLGADGVLRPDAGHIIASTDAIATQWTRRMLGTASQADGFPVYGLWETMATVKTGPNAGQITPTPGPIWPQQPWYQQHIKYSHGRWPKRFN